MNMKIKSLILGATLVFSIQSVFSQPNNGAPQTPPVAPCPAPPVSTDPAAWLKEHEEKLSTTTDPRQRIMLLRYMAPAAWAAKQADKADAYANELISLGGSVAVVSRSDGTAPDSDAIFI